MFCLGALPFEVASGRPLNEFSINSDNLNWGNSRGKFNIESCVGFYGSVDGH